MNSRRRELYDLTKAAEAKIKKLKGMSDALADDWEEIVSECEKEVLSSANKGRYKYFFDASNHSMKTTEKVATSLKALAVRLGVRTPAYFDALDVATVRANCYT